MNNRIRVKFSIEEPRDTIISRVKELSSNAYVGALGLMGLYEPTATLWNGGADQLKFPADQLKLHGCVHFTKEIFVCGFKMSKKWSFGPI